MHCLNKYADKNSHKIWFQNENHLLLDLFKIFTNDQRFKSDFVTAHNINLSFIFYEKDNTYYSQKPKILMRHFLRVFYGIHILEKVEISLKTKRISDRIPNYEK